MLTVLGVPHLEKEGRRGGQRWVTLREQQCSSCVSNGLGEATRVRAGESMRFWFFNPVHNNGQP